MRRAGRVFGLPAAILIGLNSGIARAQADSAEPVAPSPSLAATDGAQSPPAAVDTWGTTESSKTSADAPVEAPAQNETAAASAKTQPATPSEASEARTNIDSGTDAKPHLRYTLERIDVRGNHRTRTRVILRYLKFKPGDILDVDDPELTLTRYRVLGTGFFRDVQFALHKGSRRGQVVLVVEVVERNTIVINDIGMGLSSDADNNGKTHPLTAYGGIDVAETNLAGNGWTLGAALAVASEPASGASQNALRVRFLDPSFLGTPWMVSAAILQRLPSMGYQEKTGSVRGSYRGQLGLGRDLSTSTQLWLYYRLETIEAKKPLSASETRGQEITPIEFDIRAGRSVLSTVRATFQLDTRDHPFLPTGGWYISTWGELALQPFGSDYDYERFDISVSHWLRIPGVPHVLRLQMFAGAETGGEVPFFEQYYIGDFTDFRAPRMLGLNFERRPPPAVFGGIIREQRYGQYAAKLGLEYRIPVFRGTRSIYGIDLFMSSGLWSLINRNDLVRMPRGYTGMSRVPLDLTANVGFRMDTSAGGLTFAFSNILGFIPLHGEGS